MSHIFRSLVCVAMMSTLVQAQEETRRTIGAEMTDIAKRFVGALNETDRGKAVLKFDDPARLEWHNIKKPPRKGLDFHAMPPDQRATCDSLLKSALSHAGYNLAVQTLVRDDKIKTIDKSPKGIPLRESDPYYFNIYGTPDTVGTWGWSFEGPHLSLNFVINNNKLVGDSPTFWGITPAIVDVPAPGTPEKFVRKIIPEEKLAFDLYLQLNDEQHKAATLSTVAPDDYRADGKPLPPASEPKGLSAADMNVPQKMNLMAILDACNANLATPIAENRMEEIQAAGVDNLFFAWAGSPKPGGGHYYRIQGPTFVVEVVDVDPDAAGRTANHMHAVWRSYRHDFGRNVTAR